MAKNGGKFKKRAKSFAFEVLARRA